MPVRRYDNWIDGDWAAVAREEPIERRSPAHGELLAAFANSTGVQVDEAVAAAKRALRRAETWSDLPGGERAHLINRWLDLIAADLERLAAIEAEETGKPIRYARGEIAWSIELGRYAAALAWQIPGEAFSHIGSQNLGLVTRSPRGIIGMIVPWNFPMVTLFQKLPFALAAGCTCVIKPSEFTSGTALEVAALAAKAGLPSGVINVVTGTGARVGEALIDHPDIQMVSFTGSTAVGKRIAQRAGEQLKRASLELGGKAANIVFADADIDSALDGVLFGYVLNQGEECVQGSRLIVEEGIARSFVERLVERSAAVRVGMPLDEATDMGALIHEQHMNKVLGHVETGKREGAKLACGGQRLVKDGLERGYFVAPTVFAGVRPDMTLFRDEIFGPVLSVTSFRTVEEAVALANDTRYGLGNGLWTKDIDKALLVSKRLHSGTVYVNTYLETAVQLPFGGVGQSGLGRENGMEGLLEFMDVKSTFVKLGKRSDALPHARA
jgi:acyl-CoA reductase-like NAD-dependent aldehyde dehydrogenase